MKIKLNLIPQYKKEEIRQDSKLRLILKLEMEAIFIVVLFFLILFSINYIIKINLIATEGTQIANSDDSKYKQIEAFEIETKKVNMVTTDIDKVMKGQLHWARLFEQLDKNFLAGIKLNNLATKNLSVFIAGKADTRDILIAFKDKLVADECFSEVNLPLSNLTAKDNVDFQMDFKMKEGCIKINK